MEESEFKRLITDLKDPDKVETATKKEIDQQKIYKKFKDYYHRVSHDDYYAAKKILDDNVELKKSLRQEEKILKNTKDKPALTEKEIEELKRIDNIIEKGNQIPDSKKIITEKITKIEESIKELKAMINNF
jgi:hypothetical protein